MPTPRISHTSAARTAARAAEAPSARQILACNVLAVILRVAGPVITDVRPHALGTPQRQVTVRLGDALLYLTDPQVAARIRQHWDAAVYLATRLPEQVSPTWLGHVPDTYPLGVTLQPTADMRLQTRWITARPATSTPAHLRILVDRLVWQVCDVQAWRTIGNALLAAQTHLEQQ